MSETVENPTGRSGASRYRRSSQSRLLIVLASLPLGRPLLEERAQPFDPVLAGERGGERLDLEPQPRLERGFQRGARGALGLTERQRRALGERARGAGEPLAQS